MQSHFHHFIRNGKINCMWRNSTFLSDGINEITFCIRLETLKSRWYRHVNAEWLRRYYCYKMDFKNQCGEALCKWAYMNSYPSFHKPLFSIFTKNKIGTFFKNPIYLKCLYFKKFFTHCKNVNPDPPSILREGMSIPISTNARQLYEINFLSFQ